MIAILLYALATTGAPSDGWEQFHAAGDPGGRELAWAKLRADGWPDDFDRTLQALRTRTHLADVPRGEIHAVRRDGEGREFGYILLVPEDYDASRSYPVQVVLHGSTRRPPWRDGETHWRWLDPFRSSDTITLFPAAWEGAMWWSELQVENLRALLDTLRATYNVDGNRCYLTGLSDGGTGTYYHALRAPTPWAAFLPLIGHPWVLGNPQEGVDGEIFAANLAGRTLFAVNGRDDALYPAAALPPYLDLFRRAGANVRYEEMPGGHTVRWWPQKADEFRAFRDAHPRDPFPERLVWETENPAGNGRVQWLIVERLGDEPAPDPDPLNTVLFPELDPPTRAEAFPRHALSGRVEIEREGNLVRVHSRNVQRIRLLLGVGELDFERPVVVDWDGLRRSFEVRPSVDVLMRWAITDGDSAMLIAAELPLEREP